MANKYGLALQLSAVYGAIYLWGLGMTKQRSSVMKVEKSALVEEKAQENLSVKSKEIFDLNAKNYDEKVKWDERVMFLNVMRRFLLRNALGNVLEVGCGTGRNINYYKDFPVIKSITFMDNSKMMLEESMKKAMKMDKNIVIDFIQGDICSSEFPNDSFDTVVDTFGICSIEPSFSTSSDEKVISALNEMARVCRKDGLVLLLEHGRSNYDFLNKTLDSGMHRHFDSWGCIWNRNILELVEKSKLEIVYQNRFHFGTTYYLICRPKE
jgi:methyltransferase OMS1